MLDRLRMCVSCRELKPRATLFSMTYSRLKNEFSWNGNPPLAGRSAYVCQSRACIETAIRGKKFQKSLKRALPGAMLQCLDESLKNKNLLQDNAIS